MLRYDGLSQRLDGSAQAMAEAHLGRHAHADLTLEHHRNRIYIDGVAQHCAELSALRLQWDPGSHSGFQYNVGLLYTPTTKVCGVMPIEDTV